MKPSGREHASLRALKRNRSPAAATAAVELSEFKESFSRAPPERSHPFREGKPVVRADDLARRVDIDTMLRLNRYCTRDCP